jgi:putative addiction module component (TIGR02574 family)
MSKVQVIQEQALRELSPDERLALAAALWESVEEGAATPEWHRELVRERLADYRRNPDDVIPGEEVLASFRRPLE